MNASQWKDIPNAQGLLYSVYPNPPLDNKSCSQHYHAFAWVRVDQTLDEIQAARDHFGLEPFYYHFSPPYFIFGSTLPHLLRCLKKTPAWNQPAIEEYFMSPYPPYRTETYYQKIYRLTPGHLLTIKAGNMVEIPFWKLDPTRPALNFQHEEEYLEQFSALLDEAVQFHAGGSKTLGLTLSGGLDSSSILVSCQRASLSPVVFTHANQPGASKSDEDLLLEELMACFQLSPRHHLIDASQFDPMSAHEWCAKVFAGPAPYQFFMLSHALHQAIAKQGVTTVFTGYGGDECVSGYPPLRGFFHQTLREKSLRYAWHELRHHYEVNEKITPSTLRKLLYLLQYSHPVFYRYLTECFDAYTIAKHFFYAEPKQTKSHPPMYSSITHFEYEYLQGSLSHSLRMRIEYSALVAKTLGFSYRYPLLYPPLVEYCFHLPLDQKRRFGLSRYLIRQYLQQALPHVVFPKKYKMTGSIAGAALEKCLRYFEEGRLNSYFNPLPFQDLFTKNADPLTQCLQMMFAYMAQFVRRDSNMS
ncbi:MAG: asparagine synthase-related protein [Legionellales bacterium]|nr:asparagine synthase-related protein [Legionellales bacterium]